MTTAPSLSRALKMRRALVEIGCQRKECPRLRPRGVPMLAVAVRAAVSARP